MNRRWLGRLALVVLLALALALPALAQRGRRFGFGFMPASAAPIKYDGRFTIVRLWYQGYPGMVVRLSGHGAEPDAILKEITSIPAHPDGSNIFRMDDPELLKFPIAYLSEPGYWYPSDSEAAGLRTYHRQGRIPDRRRLPLRGRVGACSKRRCARCCPTGASSGSTDRTRCSTASSRSSRSRCPYPGRLGERGLMGEFYGIHEGNDPAKRLMVVINYNMDIGDYMEHSGQGLYAVDPTNEAYQVRRQLLHLRPDALTVAVMIRDELRVISARVQALSKRARTCWRVGCLPCATRLCHRPKSDQPFSRNRSRSLRSSRFRLGGAPGREQERAEDLPRRLVPHGRLVVGDPRLELRRFAEQPDGFVMPARRDSSSPWTTRLAILRLVSSGRSLSVV